MTQFDRPAEGTWRFNAPPGWPTPEASWTPPPNWEPDPSWPAPPAGWSFWVPVGYASVATDTPVDNRGRMILAAKVIAGVVTFAATVAGTWIALADRPEPYTMTDWAQQANASCERNLGNVQLSLYNAALQVPQLAAAPTAPGVANPAMTSTVQAIGQVSASFRTMNGDLRAIAIPDDANRGDIDRLLTLTSDIANTLGSVATTFVDYQIGTAAPAALRESATALQTLVLDTIPEWSKASKALGLDQCAASTGTPVLVAPAATALDAEQQALADRLDPKILAGCVPAPREENAQIIAAINCPAVAAGTVTQPLVLQFIDGPTLGTWFAEFRSGLSVGRCEETDAYGEWTFNDTTVGTLACRPSERGTYLAVWTFSEQAIAVIAASATREAMYTWWKGNAQVLSVG